VTARQRKYLVQVGTIAVEVSIDGDDRVDTPSTPKSSLLSKLIGLKNFKDLPRHLRRELLGSQMNRFETEVLTQRENLDALRMMPGRRNDRLHQQRPMKELTLDMDSSVSETYGQQEGSAYNGHFACTCYHPLFCFNQYGDVEGAMLREGNVHSAKDWKSVLDPIVDRYRNKGITFRFRGDAAFANPDLYEYLERESFSYAIRLPANGTLMGNIESFLVRPVGRPSERPNVRYMDFEYQAKSWNSHRRVIAKVEWHKGELFPRIGFIVTNLSKPAKNVVRFYNQRGTAEQWIKEGKNAVR
jgi:hypothetical protein